jgi:hypothetical protein
MNIQQAIANASLKGQSIYRESRPNSYIHPTNTPECCIVTNEEGHLSPRWEPKLDDLLADDWGVTG